MEGTGSHGRQKATGVSDKGALGTKRYTKIPKGRLPAG